MSEGIKHISDASYQADVLDAQGAVVVDFWAPWCGPCRMLSPLIEELSGEYAGKITFAKMNTDEQAETPGRLGIRGIPTLIFYAHGREVDRMVGYAPRPQLKDRLDKLVKKTASA